VAADLDARREARPWWCVAAPGLLVGAVSALIGLDRRPLWLDEAFSLGAVHQLRPALRSTGGTMALYYLLLRGWLVVGESVWWMRALSVALALIALAVTVLVARRVVGDGGAAVVGVVVGLSPMWVAYAQEARSYALVMALVSTSWLAVVRGIDDAAPVAARRRWWRVHLVCALVLPAAHGLAVLQLVAQVPVVAAARPDRATAVRAGRSLLAVAASTVALLAVGADEVGAWAPPASVAAARQVAGRFTSTRPALAVALGLVVVIGIVASARRASILPAGPERARTLVPAAWGVLPLILLMLLSTVRPSMIARYAVGAAPGLALLLVVAIDAVARDRRAVRVALVGALVPALVVGRIDRHEARVADWRMAAAVVAEHAEPGDTLLLARDTTTRPPFEAAWREVDAEPVALVAPDRPLGAVLRIEPREIPNDERWRAARGADRLWIVGSVRDRELDRLPHVTEGWGPPPATHPGGGRWIDDAGDVTVVLLEPVAGPRG